MEPQHLSPEGHSKSDPFGQGVWHFSASTQSMPQLFPGRVGAEGVIVPFATDGVGVRPIGDWLMLVGSCVVEYTEGVVDGEDNEVGLPLPIEGLVEGVRVPYATDGVGVGAIGDWLMLVGSCVVEYTEGVVDGEDNEVGLPLPIEGLVEVAKVPFGC
jgi:hypothetical protein